MDRAIAWEGSTIRKPEYIHQKGYMISKVQREAEKELSATEIEERTGFPKRTVHNIQRATRLWTNSLEKSVGKKVEGNRQRLKDLISDQKQKSPEETLLKNEDIKMLADSLKMLKWDYPRYHRILVMRFGLESKGEEMTNDEIAKEMKISHKRARQLAVKALNKLQRIVKEKGYEIKH